MLRRVFVSGLLLVVATLATGCLTFHSRVPVFEEDSVRIFLRSDTGFLGKESAKGHAHPVTISNIRLTHILSRLDVRMDPKNGNRRVPAIKTELLAPIARGLSQTLAKAGPNQEAVVMAFRNDHSFGIFDKSFLTSLIAFVHDDELFIFVDKIDATLDARTAKRPPEPRRDTRHSQFRMHPSESMTVVDPQTVSVAWRSSLFSRPTRTRILATGEVVRKTILLEEAPDAAQPDVGSAGLPGGLTPTQLRALADLEDLRQQGKVTEGQYQTRRAVILTGN